MTRRCATALAAVLLLGGCGTMLQAKGEVCGRPLDLTLTDMKDRAGFEARIECPGGGGVMITSSESNASTLAVQQLEAIGRLTELLRELVAAAPIAARMPVETPAPMPVLREPVPIAWPQLKPEG